MMKASLSLVSFLFAAGCTKGSPTFGVLDRGAIPVVTFDGQTARTLELASLVGSTVLKGECDARIRAIDVTVIASGTSGKLDLISVGAPHLACAQDQTFTTTLKALQDLIPGATSNQKYVIEFRAETAGGMSDPSRLTLEYVRQVPDPLRITAGGTESGAGARLATSTHYRADVRLTNRVNAGDATSGPAQTQSTSPHFQMRVGRAGQVIN